MSKEREQHPCLSKEKLEITHKLLERKMEKKYVIDKALENICQACRVKRAKRKFRTRDKLTLHLCEECFEKYQAR